MEGFLNRYDDLIESVHIEYQAEEGILPALLRTCWFKRINLLKFYTWLAILLPSR